MGFSDGIEVQRIRKKSSTNTALSFLDYQRFFRFIPAQMRPQNLPKILTSSNVTLATCTNLIFGGRITGQKKKKKGKMLRKYFPNQQIMCLISRSPTAGMYGQVRARTGGLGEGKGSQQTYTTYFPYPDSPVIKCLIQKPVEAVCDMTLLCALENCLKCPNCRALITAPTLPILRPRFPNP